MKFYILILAVVISVHLYFLRMTRGSSESFVRNESSQKILIKLKEKLSNKEQQPESLGQSDDVKVDWKSLKVSESVNTEAYKVRYNDGYKARSALGVWAKIQDALHYPKEFGALDLSGKVLARIYVNNSGLYSDKHTQLSCSSPYLCILVRRILRKAFVVPLSDSVNKSSVYYRTVFDFDIGINPQHKEEVESKSEGANSFYFYSYRYGAQSGLEKATHGIFEAIKSISNLAHAMKYLRIKNVAEKASIRNFLINYQNDPYWGKDD